jgi:catechol 2,3-dioxygenase-like lactoylglutathione lyase family enzyme
VAKHREAGNLPFCLRGEKKQIYSSLAIFPTPDIKRTSDFYVNVMGFRAVEYLNVEEPHICLYRDDVEIVLLKANADKIYPNRELYGYGEDAYFITDEQETLLNEFREKGAKIVRELALTDYNNREFTIEDIDGRRLIFGIKEK